MSSPYSFQADRPLPRAAQYALTLALVAAATLAAVLFEARTGAPNPSLVFVLPVVVAAVAFGWGPALTGAVAGVMAYNFFLIEPRHTFAVAQPQNVWALLLLVAVAALVSVVAAESRRRALGARRAADQATALQALARTLVGAVERGAIAQASAEALARLFATGAVVFVETETGVELAGLAGLAEVSPADLESARWAMAARAPVRADSYPVDGSAFDFWPVMTAERRGAAIGVRFAALPGGRPHAAEALVDIVGGYLSVALSREALARLAFEAKVERASERLKSDLLAAVSHDLRTPLSTILFSLQSLRRFPDGHDAAARAELLSLAETETARLAVLVENLLDMGRLDAGAVVVRRERLAPSALADAALARSAGALVGRRVEREGAGAPLLCDPKLAEAALASILENAGKYADEGAVVRLRLGDHGGEGWIEVEDEGPGFPAQVEPLFARFARGVEGDGRPPGVGLGLSIARGFAEAQDGRVEAANRADGKGAVVRLILPLAGPRGASE